MVASEGASFVNVLNALSLYVIEGKPAVRWCVYETKGNWKVIATVKTKVMDTVIKGT